MVERKQTIGKINTMRFCSFDQDNNVNVIQQQPIRNRVGKADIRQKDTVGYSLPSQNKPPAVQMGKASKNRNNRYQTPNESGATTAQLH